MHITKLTETESRNLANYHISSLGIGIAKGEYQIEDIGDILPGAVMVQDLGALKLTYMNRWGYENLNHSLEELTQMGDEYYKKFFIEEESRIFMPGMNDYVKKQDPTSLYGFYQTVKTGRKMEPGLFYTACKLLRCEHSSAPSNKLILISNPVPGMGLTNNKLSKLLTENEYAAKNHQKFLTLTRREKDIISQLVEGKSSSEISDILFISCHTVTTHRKNISRKLNISSFAELFKFANAFDLVRY